MFDKKLLEGVVNQINTFSSERKEQAFKCLNEIAKKQKEMEVIEGEIELLEQKHKKLVLEEDGLVDSIFRDIKTLHSIKEAEDKEKEKLSSKKQKVKIPIILVWD